MTVNKVKLKLASKALSFYQVIKASDKPIIIPDVTDAFTSLALQKIGNPFIAFWLSSLGLSSRRGFPDVYSLSPRDMIEVLHDLKISNPGIFLVVDADNGGQSWKNTSYAFQTFATNDVSLAFLENKKGVKYNSVDQEAGGLHELEDRELFALKVNHALAVQNSVMVGIRIEDAILYDSNPDLALEKALQAVDYYMYNCKPHAFLFHWKKNNAQTVIDFAKKYHSKYKNIPDLPFLTCIPTTYYDSTTNEKLFESGYKLIIFGNIFLRGYLESIYKVTKILTNNLSLTNNSLATVEDIFAVVGK